jgi:hypothetical protein
MYVQEPEFLEAAKAAALLTPDLFGGPSVIRGATRTSQITLDAVRIDRNSVRHSERAFAMLVQAMTNPEQAERISGITGSPLTAGRLMATLDRPKQQALARLLLAFPTHAAKEVA